MCGPLTLEAGVSGASGCLRKGSMLQDVIGEKCMGMNWCCWDEEACDPNSKERRRKQTASTQATK